MKLVIPNFDPDERASRLKAIAVMLAIVILPPAGLWAAGEYRYSLDRLWCPTPDLTARNLCIEERRDRRWGPLKAFGDWDRRGRFD